MDATAARRLTGRLRFAHYPLDRRLAQFEFDFQPSIDRAVVAELSTLRLVEERRNALFLGPPPPAARGWGAASGPGVLRVPAGGGRGKASHPADRVLVAGSKKAAAHRPGLSHSTVKHHLASAGSTIGAETTAQLVWMLAPRLPEPEGRAEAGE